MVGGWLAWWVTPPSDTTNTAAQDVYAAIGMNGGHYRMFEDMFTEPSPSA